MGELHAAHHLAGGGAQQVHGLVGRTAGVPHLHRHGVVHRLAELLLTDVAGSRRPRRVQPAARPDGCVGRRRVTNRLLARSRVSAPPITSGVARSSTRTRPRTWCSWSTSTRRSHPTSCRAMRYRSQFWLNNRTSGTSWFGTAAYVTGSHSMKFGYQGNCWVDDREMHVNNQSLGYVGISLPGMPFFPISITHTSTPTTSTRARSRRRSSRRISGRLTESRCRARCARTIPGAGSRRRSSRRTVLPRRHLPKTDGVTGYHDITPRLGAAYDLSATARLR